MNSIKTRLFVGILIIGLTLPASAQVEEKKTELVKIRKYINALDGKIKNARASKAVKRVAELEGLKKKELGRAQRLGQEIATLEKAKIAKPEVVKVKPAELKPSRRFQVEIGYGGGAGILGIGYTVPVQNFDLLFDAGYGIGGISKQYSVMTAGLAGIFPRENFFIGLGLSITNLSETVTDIPGISGNIPKGSRFGIGLFGGKPVGPLQVQLGYNTALGLTAGAAYKF